MNELLADLVDGIACVAAGVVLGATLKSEESRENVGIAAVAVWLVAVGLRVGGYLL